MHEKELSFNNTMKENIAEQSGADEELSLEEYKALKGEKCLQRAYQAGIYTKEDVQKWRDGIAACQKKEHVDELLLFTDRAIERAKAMIADYKRKVRMVVSSGVWSETESVFAENNFDSANYEIKKMMFSFLDRHVEASIDQTQEFERSFAADFLTLKERNVFKSRFKKGEFESKEKVIEEIMTLVSRREALVIAWDIIMTQNTRKLREAPESVRLWIGQNQDAIKKLRGIPIFKNVISMFEELNSEVNELLSESDEMSVRVTRNDLEETENDNKRAELTSKLEEKSRKEGAREVFADALAGFNEGQTNTHIVLSRRYADGIICEDDEEEVLISSFQYRLNMAFSGDPEIAPTGLNIQSLDKGNAKKIAVLVHESMERQLMGLSLIHI